MDGTTCLPQVFVTTVTHGDELNPVLQRPRETSFHIYRGEVRPHPEFQIIFGERGAVLSRQADLAAIHLEQPVEEELPFPLLAGTEVLAGELLVMAGFAHAEHLDIASEYGARYWRKSPVTQVLTQGRVLYRQQGPYLYDGYAGGPCFREEGGEHRLVGIAGVDTGEELSFTSTFFFRPWVSSELSRAAKTARSPATPPEE
jgi:hypothetical protein